MKIPTKKGCLKILAEHNIPANIIAHVQAVCDFSMRVCNVLERRKIKANRKLVQAAALLHDIKKVTSQQHEIDGAELVRQLGYPEVAEAIKRHGLARLDSGLAPRTWEEKIVFYSDKRLNGSKLVTVDERFEYITKHYHIPHIQHEIDFTKKIEKELLGNEKLN